MKNIVIWQSLISSFLALCQFVAGRKMVVKQAKENPEDKNLFIHSALPRSCWW